MKGHSYSYYTERLPIRPPYCITEKRMTVAFSSAHSQLPEGVSKAMVQLDSVGVGAHTRLCTYPTVDLPIITH